MNKIFNLFHNRACTIYKNIRHEDVLEGTQIEYV